MCYRKKNKAKLKNNVGKIKNNVNKRQKGEKVTKIKNVKKVFFTSLLRMRSQEYVNVGTVVVSYWSDAAAVQVIIF